VPALQSARRLRQLSEGSLAPADRLDVLAHRLALGQETRAPALEVVALADEVRRTFDELPDETLGENPVPGRWAASVLRERDDVRRVARVLRVCGWPRADEAALRQAGASIAQLDLRLSRESRQAPGMLARESGIRARDSLTATWSDFLLTAGEERAGDVAGRLLEEHADAVSADLVAALAIVMRSALGVWTRAPEAPAAAPESGRPRYRVSKQVREELVAALAREFPSRDVLRRFLRQNLDRSLDSMVPTGASQQLTVRSLVELAYEEGWLDVLVTRAREACPASTPLAQAAEQLGLSSLASSDPGLAVTRSASGPYDLQTERLAAIERQVCRVETISRLLLGTGCLIGPDLVLTADHVLSPLWDSSVSSAEVTLRFDLTTGSRDQVVTEGTLFRLGDVVWRNPKLDYTLLRVDGAPGVQPIGGGLGPGGTLRRWIQVLPPSAIGEGEELVMIGYAQNRPPALTVDRGAVVALREDSVIYALRSEPGTSGAPCFSPDLELVALNTRMVDYPGTSRTASTGVTIWAVVRDLLGHGFASLLDKPFA
jgi:hypothetical protein